FCEVCSESLVIGIYQRVRPIDLFAPASTNLSIFSTGAVAFNLSLQQPSTHGLTIQWFTNGVTVPGATNSGLNLFPVMLGNGTQTVAAKVTDITPLVRTDPANLLSQTVSWTLHINFPQIFLDSATRLSSGAFAFRISGNAPQGFSLQSSSNL